MRVGFTPVPAAMSHNDWCSSSARRFSAEKFVRRSSVVPRHWRPLVISRESERRLIGMNHPKARRMTGGLAQKPCSTRNSTVMAPLRQWMSTRFRNTRGGQNWGSIRKAIASSWPASWGALTRLLQPILLPCFQSRCLLRKLVRKPPVID